MFLRKLVSRSVLSGSFAAITLMFGLVVPGFASEELVENAKQMKELLKIQKDADVAFEDCRFGKAERLYREALEKAREIGPGDVRVAKSPGNLGRLLTVRRRFAEAEPLLEEEFYLKDRAIGHENGELVSTMEELIRFYLIYGTVEKAEPLTEDLLAIVQKKYSEQAENATSQTKLEEGTPLVGWAGTATREMQDPLLEWAVTCDKLGELYYSKKKFKMADSLYKTALDLKATVVGKKHLSLASSYEHLGATCMARNELKEAESYFREALDITEAILEPGDPRIYSPMSKLAACLAQAGKYSDAEQIYLRAARTYRGLTRCGIEQRALFALGCMYADCKRNGAAMPVLGRALKLAERASGPYSVQLVPYLKKYAYVAYQTGHRGQWQACNARANNIAPVPKQLHAKSMAKALTLPQESGTVN